MSGVGWTAWVLAAGALAGCDEREAILPPALPVAAAAAPKVHAQDPTPGARAQDAHPASAAAEHANEPAQDTHAANAPAARANEPAQATRPASAPAKRVSQPALQATSKSHERETRAHTAHEPRSARSAPGPIAPGPAVPSTQSPPAKGPAPKRVTVPSTAHVRAEIPDGLQRDLDADPRMQRWLERVISVIDGCHAGTGRASGAVEGVLTMHENARPDVEVRTLPTPLGAVVACATGALMHVKMPLFTGREGTRYPVRVHFE